MRSNYLFNDMHGFLVSICVGGVNLSMRRRLSTSSKQASKCKQASKQVSTAMETALAPLVAPIVGAARTHRARLTGAARGCVSPDGSASARVRVAACGAPACASKKRRTDMQGSEGSAERRVWSAAERSGGGSAERRDRSCGAGCSVAISSPPPCAVTVCMPSLCPCHSIVHATLCV
jgi:hypothetical protein